MDRVITHNYHTHTHRCNHAEGPDRAYVEAALAAGVTTLGFSDHVPMPYMADGRYSSFRMKPEEIDDYVGSIKALQEEFKDRIEILIGYEAEYYPDVYDDMITLLESHGYDYLILGQHFIHDSREEVASGSPTDDEKNLAAYVENVLTGLSKGKYSYIAHPGLINFTGDDEIYYKHIRLLCEECKKMNIPLELNLLGLSTGRHYPSGKFFTVASEVGNEIIIGCDAHNPRVFGDQKIYQQAFDFIAENRLTLKESL